ncbi:MAG TPA: DUF2169 domain-containing protein [Nannocystis sp.]|jgi:hypothetical protein
MELVNYTPVPAQLRVSTIEGRDDARHGIIAAKATYTVASDGTATLETQTPYPLFEVDQPTPFGLLPADSVPRRDRALEVIVLGAAHGQGRARMTVELEVGRHRQSLLVTGDRYWTGQRRGAEISEPLPIDRMPLNWDRAHGGSAECWIDEHSILDLEHPMNRYGRGFDAGKLAQDLGKAFRPPAGYPRLAPDYRRWLPNIEDPRHPIDGWNDDPRPYCWATLPTDIGAHVQQAHDRVRDGEPMTPDEMLQVVYHRAHPDWVLPVPPSEASVTLRGMTTRGTWSFRLPRLQVFADYELGERTGTRELEPHLLMLLPEESRFYLVYRHFFTMEVRRGMRRSFRLRLAEGWNV